VCHNADLPPAICGLLLCFHQCLGMRVRRLHHPYAPIQASMAEWTAALKLQTATEADCTCRLLSQVCKACGVDKPASEFYRNRTNADGLFGADPPCCASAAHIRQHLQTCKALLLQCCLWRITSGPWLPSVENLWRLATAIAMSCAAALPIAGKCKLCSDTQAETNRKPRVRHNIQEPTVEQKVNAGWLVITCGTSSKGHQTRAFWDGMRASLVHRGCCSTSVLEQKAALCCRCAPSATT
jgi:hypothetical protein